MSFPFQVECTESQDARRTAPGGPRLPGGHRSRLGGGGRRRTSRSSLPRAASCSKRGLDGGGGTEITQRRPSSSPVFPPRPTPWTRGRDSGNSSGGSAVRPRIWTAAVVAFGIAAALAAWGTWGGDGDHSTGDYLLVLAVIAVAVTAVYRLVLQRWGTPRTGIILGVLALLTLVVFWSGLPVVLGVAAFVIGLSYRGSGDDTRAATAAIALGRSPSSATSSPTSSTSPSSRRPGPSA